MAYRHARFNTCEFNTAVFNLVPYTLLVTIGGTTRGILVNRFNISQTLENAAQKASIVVYGFTPEVGQPLVMADDGVDRVLFRGVIVSRQALNQEGEPVIWDCEAIDNKFLLDKHALVCQSFDNVGLNSVITQILTNFTDPVAAFKPGIISSALGNVTVTFDGVSVSTAINRAVKQAGAFWEITPNKYINAFTTHPDTSALSLADTTKAEQVQYKESLDQTRNRVLVYGGGSQTTIRVAAGATEIPVDDVEGYSSGTQVFARDMVIDYTGVDVGAGPGSLTGCSGITNDIRLGDPVHFASQQDDTAAQTAMATTLGSGLSGILTHKVVNNTITSGADAINLAAADLAFYADPHETLSYRLVHNGYLPGKTVSGTITSPFAISGTFRVQSVSLTMRGDPSALSTGSDYEITRTITAGPVAKRAILDVTETRV